jgi:hypothetical protein
MGEVGPEEKNCLAVTGGGKVLRTVLNAECLPPLTPHKKMEK